MLHIYPNSTYWILKYSVQIKSPKYRSQFANYDGWKGAENIVNGKLIIKFWIKEKS
jgi:hypothetical protein